MGLWLSWSADGQHRKGYAWPVSHQRIEFTDLARSQGRSVRAKIVTSTTEPQKLRTAGLGSAALGQPPRWRHTVFARGQPPRPPRPTIHAPPGPLAARNQTPQRHDAH